MTNIITQLLEKIGSKELDIQIAELCDQIFEEEEKLIIHKTYIPVGPNIFLALETPGITQKEIAFLCLEREFKEKYVISLWTGFLPKLELNKGEKLKKIRIWNIDDSTTPEKVLKEYAKVMKFMKGL